MKKKIKDLTEREISEICVKNKCHSCPLRSSNYGILTEYGCILYYKGNTVHRLFKGYELNQGDFEYFEKEVEAL